MKKFVARNIRVFSDEEISFLNNSYDFEINGKMILVKSKKINKITAHPKSQFKLNTKICNITITLLAIQTWEYQFRNEGYSLFEVQNAINKLIVLYQEPNQSDIEKILKRKDEKIKILNN